MLCPWTIEHRDDQCVVSNSGQYLLPVDKCRNREYFESCLFNVPAFSNMQWKIIPQPAVLSSVFIALTGYSAYLKMFPVFILSDIYCKLSPSPEWPFRNFYWVPVFWWSASVFTNWNFRVRICCRKKNRSALVQKTCTMCGNGMWLDVNFSVNSTSNRQGSDFRYYIPLAKNLQYDNLFWWVMYYLSSRCLGIKVVMGKGGGIWSK